MVIVPLLGGLATIIVLVVYQYRAKRPLLTVRHDAHQLDPGRRHRRRAVRRGRVGVGDRPDRRRPGRASTARCTSGCSICPRSAVRWSRRSRSGIVITRRAMHYLPLVGMVLLAAGIVVFRIEVPSSQALTLVGSGLTGLGLGATVAPALFVAGFSLPPATFSECSRSSSSFGRWRRSWSRRSSSTSPTTRRRRPRCRHRRSRSGSGSGSPSAAPSSASPSMRSAVPAPQTPDLDQLPRRPEPAWYSPPLLARIRSGARTPTLVPESID